MNNQTNSRDGYIKKETMWLFVLAALATGFVAGIIFSVYKSPTSQPTGSATQQNQPQTTSQNDSTAAILALEKEVLINPTNVEAWTNLGNYYFDSENFEKAIQAYQKSLTLSPNNANVLTDLGIMFRRSGKPNDAITSFEKALAIDVNHPSARFNIGIVKLYDLGDQDGAIKIWEELVRINPDAKAPNGQPVSEVITAIKNQ